MFEFLTYLTRLQSEDLLSITTAFCKMLIVVDNLVYWCFEK
jgi:hypothetical protein